MDGKLFPIHLVNRIGWQSGVSGQAVRLHLTAHAREQAVSVLHKRRGHGPAICLLSGDQRTDSEQADFSPCERGLTTKKRKG